MPFHLNLKSIFCYHIRTTHPNTYTTTVMIWSALGVKLDYWLFVIKNYIKHHVYVIRAARRSVNNNNVGQNPINNGRFYPVQCGTQFIHIMYQYRHCIGIYIYSKYLFGFQTIFLPLKNIII